MSRVKGARDLSRRKKRSDINKRRLIYANKPTKPKRKFNGNLVYYKSKRKRGDPVKIQYQILKRMKKEGYAKWGKSKKKTDKISKRFLEGHSVNPNDISTPEGIGQTAIDILGYPGVFNFLMSSHSKNVYRVSPKKKAKIIITETEEGLHAKVVDFSQMRHYGWFWKG